MTLAVVVIEAGGTRTRGWIVDGVEEPPRVLAHREVGPGNFQRLGAAAWGALMRELYEALLAESGVPVESVCAISVGSAGISTDDDVQSASRALRAAGVALPATVGSDAGIAMHGALAGKAGVLLIAGTGSIVWGWGPTGTLARVGGWGSQLGDEGSGYALGRAMLRRLTRALDGRAKDAGALDAACQWLKVPGAEALAAWIRAHAGDAASVASASQLVFSLARSGDGEAAALIDQGARELAEMVRTAIVVLGLSGAVRVVVHGGLIQDPQYRGKLQTVLAQDYPEIDLRLGAPDIALLGGISLAKRMIV